MKIRDVRQKIISPTDKILLSCFLNMGRSPIVKRCIRYRIPNVARKVATTDTIFRIWFIKSHIPPIQES
ncbi:hypothetical protein D3C75_956830 [compost metagenome]